MTAIDSDATERQLERQARRRASGQAARALLPSRRRDSLPDGGRGARREPQLRFLTQQPGVVNDVALLVLRLAVATVFIVHGAADVFDAGVSTNVENYRDAGIPLAELSAPFTAYVQLVGGIAVVLGALTRPVSAGFIVAMAGALIYVHSGEPLAIQPDGSGFGFAFIMGAASLTLLLLGPGRLSLDRLLADRRTQRADRPLERTAHAA